MGIVFDMFIGEKLVEKVRNTDANSFDGAIDELKKYYHNRIICNFSTLEDVLRSRKKLCGKRKNK